MPMATETDDWLPTRRSLLTRLRHADDQAGWQEFFDAYWRLLYGVARKAGLNDAEAQDAVQDCVIIVSRQMPKFRYQPERCSFKGWLLMILRQRVGRQLRKRQPAAAGALAEDEPDRIAMEETRTDAIDGLPDPAGDELEAIWETEWQQHLLALAKERVKQQVSDAQFQIFDLHVLRGWRVREVARTLDVSVAMVYLAKLRVGRRFRQEVALLQREHDAVTDPRSDRR
jgi:RNA polymerase sigma-70 factor (ECF subfamily)